jgi:hypothetical protein
MVLAVITAVQHHEGILTIAEQIEKLRVLDLIDSAYVQQSSYWLTFFPFVGLLVWAPTIADRAFYRLRGFLALFDLAQLLNLFIISIKTRSVIASDVERLLDISPCTDSLDARRATIESSQNRQSSSTQSTSEPSILIREAIY